MEFQNIFAGVLFVQFFLFTIECIILFFMFKRSIRKLENYNQNKAFYSLLDLSSIVAFLLYWLGFGIFSYFSYCSIDISVPRDSTFISGILSNIFNSVLYSSILILFVFVIIRIQEDYKDNIENYKNLFWNYILKLSLFFFIRFFLMSLLTFFSSLM